MCGCGDPRCPNNFGYPSQTMTYEEACRRYGRNPIYEKLNKLTKERKPMRNLSIMQKLLMAKDDQTLTKAGYLNGDMELTEKGQEALDSILFAANKEAMVKLAQADLDEEAAQAKK